MEQALAVNLPADFRAAVLAMGSVDYGPVSLGCLSTTNQQFRQSGLLNHLNDEPWAAHYLRIGGDGTGQVSWFVRCDVATSGIWECDHDAVGGVTKVTNEVGDFLQRMLWE